MFWFATGLACGDFRGFVVSANGGIDGDLDLDCCCEPAALLGDLDDDACSEEEAPVAKADGGATCRGLWCSADLKGPMSNCDGSTRFAMPAVLPESEF